MVRRNWQMRVEVTEARRQQAKQRKQKNEDKRQYKLWVQELLRLLDAHADRWWIQRHHPPPANTLTVHVWTDALPCDSPPAVLDWLVLHQHPDPHHNDASAASSLQQRRSSSGKIRSNSISEETSDETVRGRTGQRRPCKKKVHPRSREQTHTTSSTESSVATTHTGQPDPTTTTSSSSSPCWLCHSHFFTGTCDDLKSRGSSSCGKKSSCRYLHYVDPFQTLHHVMTTTTKLQAQQQNFSNRLEELAAAETAAAADMELETSVPAGAMDMLFYVSLNLQPPTRGGENQDDEQQQQQHTRVASSSSSSSSSLLSEQIARAFIEKELKLSNVVYMSIGTMLVFDRNRNGILISSDEEFAMALTGNNTSCCVKPSSRKLSIASENDGDDDDDDDDVVDEEIVHRLPGIVLEHILTFLPDQSVAAASQVCQSWYYEIGQNSPNLWQHMFQRRNWPLPSDYEQDHHDTEESFVSAPNEWQRLRKAFLGHYSVVRDANAIQSARLSARSKHIVSSKEMAYHDFVTRKNAPGAGPNSCVSVHVWGPKQILVAHQFDCSLRLFETTAKADGSGLLGCKELVVQKVDPYRNTKKRTTYLTATALDEEFIGCLCRVHAEHLDLDTHILVVVSRDEYLLGESSSGQGGDTTLGAADGNLKVIDIGEAVLNYILSMEEPDHRTVELVHFLQDGGEIGEIEVQVQPTIAACGYGRFLLEVTVLFPNDQTLGRMLVLLSAGSAAIIWTSESKLLFENEENEPDDLDASTMISALRRQDGNGSRVPCSIALSPCKIGGPITILEVGSSGQVSQTELMIKCPGFFQGGDMIFLNCERRMRMSSTHVVVVDVFATPPEHNDNANGDDTEPSSANRVCIVTFVPRFAVNEEDHQPPRRLELRHFVPIQLVCVRDDHMILLCEKLDEDHLELCAILWHVPSCREIDRQVWARADKNTDYSFQRDVVMTVDMQETLCVGFSGRGVVMTGDDVRAVGSSSASRVHIVPDLLQHQQQRSAKKGKKKKKAIKSSGKKDGFARGMSLRG